MSSAPQTQPPPEPRWMKRVREWLVALPALAVTGMIYYQLVKVGRSSPTAAYIFAAVATLALVFDVLMLLRGRSMILVIGVIFGSVAVIALVPRLEVGIPLAVLAAAGYCGLMLLVAFRKKK